MHGENLSRAYCDATCPYVSYLKVESRSTKIAAPLSEPLPSESSEFSNSLLPDGDEYYPQTFSRTIIPSAVLAAVYGSMPTHPPVLPTSDLDPVADVKFSYFLEQSFPPTLG